MQLFLTLSGDSIDLPINYRPLVHGVIYRALSSGPSAVINIHNMSSRPARPAFKGFTFSPLLGLCRVKEQKICFTPPITLEIRSIDPIQIAVLYHYFMTERSLQLGSCILHIDGCRLEDQRIETPEISIYTLSPAVNYSTNQDGYATYFDPTQEEFFQALLKNAKRKAAFYHLPPNPDLSFSLVPGTVPRKQLSSFKKTPIIGWFCDLYLRGDPRTLDMLYQTGIGSKNPEGYGLFVLTEPAAVTS